MSGRESIRPGRTVQVLLPWPMESICSGSDTNGRSGATASGAAKRGPRRDRRRSQRRRARLRSLMFTAVALVLPYQMKEKPLAWFGGSPHPSGPRVTTSIESVEAVPPVNAYDAIIDEAAQRYR